MTGRKRHLVVDTLGLVVAVVVHPADIQDRDGARLVLAKLVGRFRRLRLIWADAGYAGELVGWVKARCRWGLDIVRRRDTSVGFEVLPRRWVVERTFAWFGKYRRLSKACLRAKRKDYEYHPRSSETMLHLAMIHLMVRRLARSGSF